MPNLLAIRQSRNLFNFGQYKLFIDYIFHVLHTKVVYKERKAEKLPYNFIYVARAITSSTLMAVAQNETYQQIVNGQYIPVYSEDAEGEARTRNPWITNPVL